MPPFDPTADLQARLPVWEALSELFLDTDITATRPWRAEQLAASPYSLAELEAILLHEVHPVCKYNLMSVAGVWTGFDADALGQKIVAHLGTRRSRMLRALDIGRLPGHLAAEWHATATLVAETRQRGVA